MPNAVITELTPSRTGASEDRHVPDPYLYGNALEFTPMGHTETGMGIVYVKHTKTFAAARTTTNGSRGVLMIQDFADLVFDQFPNGGLLFYTESSGAAKANNESHLCHFTFLASKKMKLSFASSETSVTTP